jgi:hypothetical protein
MPPRPGAPPRRLPGSQVLLFTAGVPLALAVLTVSILGLLVLMGEAAAGCGSIAVLRCLECFPGACECNAICGRATLLAPCADSQGTGPLAHTTFATLWRRAVQHNPFVQAFSLNFGAIGACVRAVWEARYRIPV